MRKRAIAIDFDGCICTDAWPEIGQPNWDVIAAAKREQDTGSALILWTCREGKLLQDALEASARWGLSFDAVNANLPDWIKEYGNNPRKVGADEYWDDKAMRMPPDKPKTVFNNFGNGGTFIDNVDGTITINIS